MTDGRGGESSDFQPGMIVGRKFALLQQIAEGGGGSLYEAHDLLIGRRVALKLLHPNLSRNPLLVKRFRQEAKATAAIVHPNVVSLYEMGRRRDGSYYIAEELLDGPSLRERLNDTGALGLGETIDILLPVMEALWVAHLTGIVHRDVKPDNIILARRPGMGTMPKLVDFGVAKLFSPSEELIRTADGKIGTPAYMAPEQVAGDAVDGRTDVWAVGVVLFELLTERTPFPGPGQDEIFAQVQAGFPAEERKACDEVSKGLGAVVGQALSVDPAERYATMAEFRQALAGHVGIALEEVDTKIELESVDQWYDANELSEQLLNSGEWDLPPSSQSPARVLAASAASAASGAPPEAADGGDGGLRDDGSLPMASEPPSNPELGWSQPPRLAPSSETTAAAREAEESLGLNALHQAIEQAQLALREATGVLRCRMWLVQTIANLWLGNYAECERTGRLALEGFELGSTGWYVAAGHVASVSGILAKGAELEELRAELSKPDHFREPNPARDIAICRLVIVLLRAGHSAQAHQLFTKVVEDEADPSEHTLVRAWMEVVRANFAAQVGDAATYLQHIEGAVEHFAFEGDVRNAALQRHNVGNAYMQLGAYGRAAAALKDVLEVSESMQLNIVPPAKANLGFALARLGQIDAALEAEWAALKACKKQGNRRFEAVAHVYLGLILGLDQRVEEAEEAARKGVEAAAVMPPLLALAKASLAGILLMRNRGDEALTISTEALELLEELGGAEEGDALARLVHTSALTATGQHEEARKAIAVARRRLLERAERIGSATWQKSFLENVPENARTLEVAAQWLDEGRPSELKIGPRTMPGLGEE